MFLHRVGVTVRSQIGVWPLQGSGVTNLVTLAVFLAYSPDRTAKPRDP